MDYSGPRALAFFPAASKAPLAPIRAEIFGIDRLEQHAESLATAQHAVTTTEKGRSIAPRLEDNTRKLREAYKTIIEASRTRRPITPAAEWLLDNFHIVDEQIREIKDDLPPSFYRKLPKLRDGHLQGFPRIFGIAWALVAHTDSAIDLQKLTRFVQSYQRIQPLLIGELWAIAITLRIVLVENLRRLAESTVVRISAHECADLLADRLLNSENDPNRIAAVVQDLNRAPWSMAFAVHLAQRLRDQGPEAGPAIDWLNQRLAAAGTSSDQITRDEVQDQGAANVTVRNIIMSMRLVSTTNWPDFFESVSLVDSVLRHGSDFASMDFPTRDLYRNAIEELSRGSAHTEIDAAEHAVAAAKRATKDPQKDENFRVKRERERRGDPGYYLIGKGRRNLEKELSCRASLKTRLIRANSDFGVASYVLIIAFFSVVLLAFPILGIIGNGAPLWLVFLLVIAGIVPASDIAVSALNLGITRLVGPRLLPALELRDGIPDSLRTMVAIPTLLTTPDKIEEQVERLEVHFLANAGANLFFALLTDWTDADAEKMPDDESLLKVAVAGIARLNERHVPPGGETRFFLYHRHRVWNEGEGKWMGWERKRGKLHELNRLLRGAGDTTFIPIENKPSRVPANVCYVLTVDADTRLPIDTAKRLIAKIAHPLNRARIDPYIARVVEGFGILQPRVTPSLPIGSGGSLFQRTFSGPDGLDPYARVVSDIYQDLYEEGSYWGKGIYEVDAFETALDGRIPESAVLSHDLLEGIVARAGIASDVEVIEEFPSRYEVSVARQHRWVRGDWQLLPWIFAGGRKVAGLSRKPSIPMIGRWRLLDNLRRSLSAPSALFALLCGWLLPFDSSLAWSGFILLTIILPPLFPALLNLIPRRADAGRRNFWRSASRDLALGLLQSAFLITFLAHQAWLMTDAVIRTLYRLFIRRRGLLEWVTAAQIAEETQLDRRNLTVQLGNSLAFAAALVGLLYLLGRQNAVSAAPLIALWAFSPFIARWVSVPPAQIDHKSIEPADARTLRRVARQTWRFFEQFITEEDNMLPPDNFQEDPKPLVAHRTSPTNFGLYLLSVIAARDFGWIGTLDALDRLEKTLAAMDRLEKFRGHFFNWYDTRDCRVLEPKYISTVDSGNLAGHLIALVHAGHEIIAGPLKDGSWISGAGDTLELLQLSLKFERNSQIWRNSEPAKLQAAIDECSLLLEKPSSEPLGTITVLKQLVEKSQSILGLILDAQKADGSKTDTKPEVAVWAEALRSCAQSHLRDFEYFMPWLASTVEGPKIGSGPALTTMPTISALYDYCQQCVRTLSSSAISEMQEGASDTLRSFFEKTSSGVKLFQHRVATLTEGAKATALAMEFGFLLDKDRKLLSIGYRYSDGALDSGFYDLLASEARLASFFAIAKGDLPSEHWFRLGRAFTAINGSFGLLSWSGSMFEYLMPSLVMRGPAGSILEETVKLVVRHQEDYGRKLGIPWGISESEYNARDIDQNYQYAGFGVPDLGFKRGLNENTVVAPYATGLAAMVDPEAAARNFERFSSIGASGHFGMYEALDYTRDRLPEGATVAIIKAYMAHHQAMTIVAINNALLNGVMRERFHAEPLVQAAELLLQERMPRDVIIVRPMVLQTVEPTLTSLVPEAQRRFTSPHSRIPRTQLLSNGRYAAMVTAAGSGYSRWKDIEITRWREDATCDNWGSYLFLRDVQSRQVWSMGYQPTAAEPDSYEVTFSEDRIQFVRSDNSISTTLEIVVSPEEDAEVRRISITNNGPGLREIELTSYAELVLDHAADDLAHPAFAKLFVETEFVPHLGAILATRRQRSSSDPQVWAAHLSIVEGDASIDVQFETDRARFLGRGQGVRAPAAIADGWPLSDTTGAVLDPIFSLRRRLRLPKGATARVLFWTAVGSTRDQVLGLADKLHDPMAVERASTLAWTQAQMQLRHLGISSDEAHLFQRLANNILYLDASLRPTSDILRRGGGKKSLLWSQGISGDLPILLVEIEEQDDLEFVRTILRAREYLRLKQLAFDIVFLNDRASSYVQDFHNALEGIVRAGQAMPKIASDEIKGGVFILRSDLVSPEYRNLLRSIARVVLQASRGSLSDQLDRARDIKPITVTPPKRIPPAPKDAPLPRPQLDFFNGLGGFTKDAREYVTILDVNERTPAPWVNVVANPSFGFTVSVDGGGFTWSTNSQQNQLTPWSNDPVSDMPGEIIYLRDEESGEVWSPTSRPIREKTSSYKASHGQGYSRFEYVAHGLSLELLQFVPITDPVKIFRLKITNQSGRDRSLSVTSYVEWVLGTSRSASAPFIVTEIDSQSGAMFAQNPWSDQFGQRIGFADLNGKQTAWTGDRTEFLGRDGTAERPAALMNKASLSGRVGPGLDPCCALQTPIKLGPIGTAEIIIFVGEGESKADARTLLERYRQADLQAVFKEVTDFWDNTLGAVQVKTPDRALDVMVNRWLLYQTLSSRVWARTGFYQASGAYGFRDQLQDVMALCISRPDLARAHILRAAGRQFAEGDVQHWWLPESGQGIRTRVSDDRGWLAYTTAHYVEVTGDTALLDEMIPFLDGPVLRDGEQDAFFQPATSAKSANLFEHCALALDQSLATGSHDLPLMGTGDWNDGMNNVGRGGKGESVWLAWFLISALSSFADLAEQRGAGERAKKWRDSSASFKAALEKNAWDGDWYRRGYFDDGTPLGSVSNNECRIDSIAQSWAVISGAAEPSRAQRAMAAVDKYLVRRDQELALLFSPPFDHPSSDPGYIKGYPPGIRENGGQYTHAAVWTALAWTMLGEGDKAGELLSMLNPINHARNRADVDRYKVEPYVVCADVYSVPPHTGRGGWTWYTGSSGWMYRVALEHFLGFRLKGTNLMIDPCIPKGWPGFEITFRYRSATYNIIVENPLGVSRGILATRLDGEPVKSENHALIPLNDDGNTHRVQVVLG